MTTTTLYGQATKTVTANGAGNPGTIGTHFTVSSACTLDGVWLYSPSGHSLTQLPTSIALWTTQSSPATGTLVTSNTASWSGAAGSGWVFAAFTTPPTLASGTQYMAGAFRNDAVNAWFVYDEPFTFPVSNSPITAPKDTGALGQGWFTNTTTLAFPASQDAGFNWYLDPQVSAGTSRTATASLTVTPVLSSAAARGRARTASLTVTPVLSATVPQHRTATAALTVTPVLSAGDVAAHRPAASLTVAPSLSAARIHASVLPAALTVSPVLTASARGSAGPPPAYPDGDLAAMVELFMGGAWTDLTEQALPDGQQYGSVKAGQGDGSQQPTPGAMNGTWDNPDYSLSPRNSTGPYYGQLRQNTPARVSFESPYGSYLRLEADSDDRAYVDDTAALHVTGSLELRLEAFPSDYRGCVLAARYDDTAPSWYWTLNRDGTLTFSWYDSSGTQRTVTSPQAAAVSWKAFRVTLDAASGDVGFFVSDGIDGSWTTLGDAASATSGAATTVRAGNAPLAVGWSANLDSSQMRGQVSGFRLYDGVGGAVAADAAFSIQVPGVTTWTSLDGLTWNVAGGAELTARDYRLHGELATLAPTAHQSSSLPRLTAQLAGRMGRLQQGYAPALASPMRRAVLSQPGSLYPVNYWPMEEAAAARAFGPAVGTTLLNAELGKVKPAADSSFEASAPLPTLNGDQLSFTAGAYSGATAWAVRFLYKKGSTLPASGTSCRLVELATTGACATVTVSVNDSGNLDFAGKLAGGASAFSVTNIAYAELAGPAWWSVEATVSGSGVNYALVAVAPGAGSGDAESQVVTGHGSFGVVTGGTVNADLILTDTVFGHLSVQKAWASMFTLGAPLNAWRNELAADRFARVCAELGITCRIVGRPAVTQAMGPQPRGSGWTVLLDCANTEQGLLFEPRGCFGLGLRTAESMAAQAPAVTLDFAAANLRGDLQPVDDSTGFLNDITIAMPNGTQYRVTLDDGSAKSVSEPRDGGTGAYAGQPPFSFNVADASQLAGAAALYLKRASVDEARYRNMAADFGIPGAPVKDMARVRFGDLVKIISVPGIYQSDDIEQLVTGATEAFGPGRVITWNGVPASPYTGTGGGAVTDPDSILDTDGIAILDTDGTPILDTGA